MTQPPPPPPYPPYQGYPPQEDTTMSVLVHLSWFVFGLIGPLIVYLISKDDPYKPMTRHHAAQALNFHLTMLIAGVASAILILVIIGIFLLLAIAVFGAVMAIIAAVAASRREPYRYPLCIQFVR